MSQAILPTLAVKQMLKAAACPPCVASEEKYVILMTDVEEHLREDTCF